MLFVLSYIPAYILSFLASKQDTIYPLKSLTLYASASKLGTPTTF